MGQPGLQLAFEIGVIYIMNVNSPALYGIWSLKN